MKSYILLLMLLLPFCSFASDFKFSDIPMKDGHPYYELTAPADKISKNELFHRAQLFLAEYFKKTTPEIKIEDKEDGILVARVTLSYSFLANPAVVRGRSQCLLSIRAENGLCRISIYDFELYHQTIKEGIKATPQGIIPDGEAVWSRQTETTIYKKAAEDDTRSVAELKAVNEHVQKLEEALMKKLAD
ncbi:DUF4468 domain-containing protein [Chitinophagaceae bacterium MMS25-I14]